MPKNLFIDIIMDVFKNYLHIKVRIAKKKMFVIITNEGELL